MKKNEAFSVYSVVIKAFLSLNTSTVYSIKYVEDVAAIFQGQMSVRVWLTR